MANNNTVTLIGNLGQQPETFTNDKGSYVLLRIVTTDSYKDEQTGTWKDKEPVWHTVFAFGSTVQGYAKSFKKGDRVKVEGSLAYKATETLVEGEKRIFTNAAIIANRITDARLPKKGA